MAHAENVWLPAAEDPALIVRWIRQHTSDEAYTRRALFIARKGHPDARPDPVKVYGENGNVGSNRSPHVELGGPVFALHPDLQLLEKAVRAADGQMLAVSPLRDDEVAGWVAATKAVNVVTGEPHPGVPAVIYEALEDLEDAGYNGFHTRGAFLKAKIGEPINTLLNAGYNYEFAAGFLLALGPQLAVLGPICRRSTYPARRNPRFLATTTPAGSSARLSARCP